MSFAASLAGYSSRMSQIDQPGRGDSKPKRGITFGQMFGLLLIAAAVVFIVENTQKVTVRFVGPSVHTHMYIALVIAAVLGLLGGALLRRHRQHNR